MNMTTYGWNEEWHRRWQEGRWPEELEPARIIGDFGSEFELAAEGGEYRGSLSGKYRHRLEAGGDYPGIGDWVAVRRPAGSRLLQIEGALPRNSAILRQAAGTVVSQGQLIAANVDTLFLVAALNDDFNVRRMERYLIMAWNSGAMPVILLTKADLCEDRERRIGEMESAAPGVPVHAVSALRDDGREQLESYLGPGRTVALTGSSGCGKSTVVNWLCGRELQRTQEVREDDSRGRHTTTHRELFVLPSGAVLVDTPGMRELQLRDDEGGLEQAFADIGLLAASCRYADCRHEREEGCAVLEAAADGRLEEKRLLNFRKTQRELLYQSAKEQKNKRKAGAASVKSGSRNAGRQSWRRDWEEN
ncbi:ribosome small subunit-dependent GTPase A [Paenibacillus spiritus]|uniref:Small ribosomal subunit biogenesis GTPase RsgA n=1 Tax=Paenibacillus spiritus TaxID=2496557 RepID=A0A5J5GEI3_9BACL|nr:ribosome small subunit-dependent GTPase A [Paenibacillus spiritus]KAA9006481.1 ribosome small subunit-dependent GTPase A [Paenibacillus spiritus]